MFDYASQNQQLDQIINHLIFAVKDLDFSPEMISEIETKVNSLDGYKVSLSHLKFHKTIPMKLSNCPETEECIECLCDHLRTADTCLHNTNISAYEKHKIMYMASLLPKLDTFVPKNIKCKDCGNAFSTSDLKRAGCLCYSCLRCRANDYAQTEDMYCKYCESCFYPYKFVKRMVKFLQDSEEFKDRELPKLRAKCAVPNCQIVMEVDTFVSVCPNLCAICLDCALFKPELCLSCGQENINEEHDIFRMEESEDEHQIEEEEKVEIEVNDHEPNPEIQEHEDEEEDMDYQVSILEPADDEEEEQQNEGQGQRDV